MRFVLNFIVFGFIFFLLHHYFPEQFNMAVNYFTGLWSFVESSIREVLIKAKENGGQAAAEPAKSFIIPFVYLTSLLKK